MILIAMSLLALAMIMTGSGIELKMEFYAGPFVDIENEDDHED